MRDGEHSSFKHTTCKSSKINRELGYNWGNNRSEQKTAGKQSNGGSMVNHHPSAVHIIAYYRPNSNRATQILRMLLIKIGIYHVLKNITIIVYRLSVYVTLGPICILYIILSHPLFPITMITTISHLINIIYG